MRLIPISEMSIYRAIRKSLSPLRRCYCRLKNQYFLTWRYFLLQGAVIELSGSVAINQPTFFHGNGRVVLGDGTVFGCVHGGYYRKHVSELIARLETSEIILGKGTLCNNNLFISAWESVKFGDDCLIGHNCEFSDANGHESDPKRRNEIPGLVKEIVIGNNVWFGNNCKILKGTKIGDNSIVAAGSVVSGEFGANVIIGGVPAKVIRSIDLNA